jgi:CelD/BcsL family acetyltransferase involved in cellulose biosynthesis
VASKGACLNVVEFVDVDARTNRRWHDMVASAHGSLFHGSAWAYVLADTYGFEPRALLILDGERAVNGIPWCLLDDPGGARVVSLPFSDFGGPIGSPPFTPLLEQLVGRRLPVRYRVVVDADAPDEHTPAEFRTIDRARWHGVPVTDTPELDVWPELASAARRAVAKARREGVVVVERTDAAFVPLFHRLHLGVRKRKYRLLPQPLSFFASMRERFVETGDWHPLVATRDGELLAATVYLRHGDTLFYKFNASDPAGLSFRPNDLLLWSGIELAARLGCALIDLGASDDDQPGLIRFKRRFGAFEREIRTHVAGPRPTADARDFRALLADTTRRLTAPEVPDFATATAGAVLYRYFA